MNEGDSSWKSPLHFSYHYILRDIRSMEKVVSVSLYLPKQFPAKAQEILTGDSSLGGIPAIVQEFSSQICSIQAKLN